jgi:Na+-driven multidrug efflux pump
VGLASLNLSIPVYSILHGVGMMLGVGGATRYTILQAQGNAKKAQATFSTALVGGVLTGLAFILVGLVGVEAVAKMLGADADTLPMTKTYVAILLLFFSFLHHQQYRLSLCP